MIKTILYTTLAAAMLCACNTHAPESKSAEAPVKHDTASAMLAKNEPAPPVADVKINDTLNSIAEIVAGVPGPGNVYGYVTETSAFANFSKTFNRRWDSFDSSRLAKLQEFRDSEVSRVVKHEPTLFYPFSGPDILYAYTFFPSASSYVMVGLEPVGTLPDFKKEERDSLNKYFNKINTSLNAILKYSFFRTESMGKDLRNQEVNGTIHLLLLFLKRTGNSIVSAKPVTVDSTGSVAYVASFEALKKMKTPTRGVEIEFLTKDNRLKTVYYYSLNAADGGLKYNKGFTTYLHGLGTVNTYLKGASYLMHKSYFSIIRNVILQQSANVVQDDSGIAFHYYTESGRSWRYTFYGKYTRPIPMFSQFYQKDLDSTYKAAGSKDIGFGIGYNFKDRNSNFMIATAEDSGSKH